MSRGSRRPLAGLLVASLVSVLGTSMSALAVPWFVLTTTGSAARTGVVAFAEMAPYVALQVLAGPLVDRVGARWACVLGNAAAAVAMCAIPALYAAHALSFGALVGLVAAAGAVRGLADCAENVLVPGTATLGGVPLERAAGLNSAANRAGLLLGAPLAGVLLAVAGAPVVVLVDGLTFAVAALLIGVLVPRAAAATEPATEPAIEPATEPATDAAPVAQPAPAGGLRGYGRQLAEGLRFVAADRLLVGLAVMIALTNLFDQGWFAVQLPVWVRDHLHRPQALGVIAAAMSVGQLLGNAAGAWLGPRLPRRASYAVGFLVAGAPRFVVLVLAGTLAPVVAVTLVAGFGSGGINPIVGAALYERVPPQLRARVLGTFKASAWVGIPFGGLLAGVLTEATSLDATLLAAGAGYFAVTLAPFVFPAWRGMNPAPAPGGDPVRE